MSTINNILPWTVRDGPLSSNIRVQADAAGKTFDEMLTVRNSQNPADRAGDPAEFGDACAFLCSAKSGFIVGQNLLLDGSAFNSTF